MMSGEDAPRRGDVGHRGYYIAVLAVLIATVAYGTVLLLVIRSYTNRRPHLGTYPPSPGGPLLSVIIPARNEAHNIEHCVRSVAASQYPEVEIIVVDDRSTDGTRDIVARLAAEPELSGRLRLVAGADLPAGWFGKPWALVQGYRVAQGHLLLFVDADTKHQPELIPRAITALAAERVHLVTVIPRQEVGSFWEALIQPHVFFVLAARVGNLERVNRTRVPWDAIANGQFILTGHADYEAVGTHEAVRDQVAEDVALAQGYVRAGKDIFLVHAPELMSTRMYRSLAEIIEGWSKNMALGAPLMLPPVRWLRRVAPFLLWIPSLAWILPPLLWALTGWTPAIVATVLSLVTWVLIYRNEKAPLGYALLYPLGALIVAGIMIRSAIRGARRVEWKGRTYSTSRRDA
jgi:chlorobactene glucosyltransferase